MSSIRIIYIILGSLFLGLGVLGIFLPILPTTPFLLLTLYFYARGSRKFHRWFIQTKIYQRYLSDLAESGSMTLANKWKLIVFVAFLLAWPFMLIESWWVKGLIIAVIVAKSIYIFAKVHTIR